MWQEPRQTGRENFANFFRTAVQQSIFFSLESVFYILNHMPEKSQTVVYSPIHVPENVSRYQLVSFLGITLSCCASIPIGSTFPCGDSSRGRGRKRGKISPGALYGEENGGKSLYLRGRPARTGTTAQVIPLNNFQ